MGIGTDDPKFKLHVTGDISASGLHIQDGWVSGYVLTASGIEGEAVWAELPAGGGGSYNLTGQVVSDNNGVASLTVRAIEGQLAGASVSGTDEIIYSEQGNIKRMDISDLENYMQTNLDFGDGGGGGNLGEGFWKPSPVNKLDIYYNFGKVGIGTETPDEALHVTGTIKTEGDLLMEGPLNRIVFGNSQSSTFQIGRNSTGYSSIINISADDNVGIGASANDAKLRVGGNTLVEGDIESIGNIQSGANIYSAGDISSNGNIKTKDFLSIDNIHSQLFFGAGNPSTFSLIKRDGQSKEKGQQGDIEILTVGENNFVGILTDGEPGAELEVNGEVLLKDELTFNGNYNAQIAFGKSSSTKKFKILSLSTMSPPDPGDKSSFRGICLDAYGNLGIGTDDPSADLDVSGKTKTDYLQISNNGGVDKILRSDADGNASWVLPENVNGMNVWEETGEVAYYNGSVGIGTTDVPTDYKLAVLGTIGCEKIEVKIEDNWPDFVFSDEYQLPKLSEIESFVKENHHLEGVPSAEDVKENGLDLGAMNSILLQKIEELTLLMIEQNKSIEQQQKEIDVLKEKVNQ